LLESQKERTKQIEGLAVDHQEFRADLKQLTESHRQLHEEFDRKMLEWRELSADTEQKLNALIATVDRIIGRIDSQS
jgi:ABC-type phosphate transport system auxiliary subunit